MYIHIVVKDIHNVHKEFDENLKKIQKKIPCAVFQIKMWDDNSFETFIKEKDSVTYACFKRLNKKIGAMVADFIRYNVLYYFGGVYIDIKSCLKNFFTTFISCPAICSLHVFEWDCKDFYEFVNWFIVCDAYNVAMKEVIDTLNKKIIDWDTKTKYELSVFRTTKQKVLHFCGPRLFTEIVSKYISRGKVVTVHDNSVRKKNLQYNYFKNNNYRKFYQQPHYTSVKGSLCI
jgi:mannosyltransferase OCH1-like enzyme